MGALPGQGRQAGGAHEQDRDAQGTQTRPCRGAARGHDSPRDRSPAAEPTAPPKHEEEGANQNTKKQTDETKPTHGAEPAAADSKHEEGKLDKAAKKKETDEEKAKRYEKEQEEIKEKAEGFEEKAKELKEEGEKHLEHHVGLAKSVTMCQICIAVAAVSVLTNRRLFWFVSLAFAAYGVYAMILGLAH